MSNEDASVTASLPAAESSTANDGAENKSGDTNADTTSGDTAEEAASEQAASDREVAPSELSANETTDTDDTRDTIGVGEEPLGEAGFDPKTAIEEIVTDLNNYWSEADVEIAVGYDYEPIPMSAITVGGEGLTCEGYEITEAEVKGNAFVASCTEGIIVAYDPDYVLASRARAESTLSHEWGHVLQYQAGNEVDFSTDPEGLPIDAELQADCFAGAWSAESGNAFFEDLYDEVEESGDPIGVPLHDPQAHGTAEERLAAFEVGLDGGPYACIETLMGSLPGTEK